MLRPDGTDDLPPGQQNGPFAPSPLAEALYQSANKTFRGIYNFPAYLFHGLCDIAEYLDANKHVYWLYGGPDGFVLAYSMLKYIPDLIYNGSKTETAEALRNFIYNPWGAAITVAWLSSLAIISAYANGMSKQKNNIDAQNFYVNWQAFRDGAKGLRNTDRGLVATLNAIKLFSTIDTRYALMPLALILGIPSMYNRWWNRHMVTVRKRSLDKNETLSKELLNWGRFNDEFNHLPASQKQLKKDHANSFLLINKNNKKNRRLFYIDRNGVDIDLGLSSEEITNCLKRKKNTKHPSVLQWQAILPTIAAKHFIAFNNDIDRELKENIDPSKHDHNNRKVCYLSAGYDGLLSGLYLFMGLISLVPLSPAILITVTTVSTLCIVACIITRLQEEWEYDKLLRMSEQKAELILSIKKFQAELAKVGLLTIELLALDKNLKERQSQPNYTDDNPEIKKLKKEIEDKHTERMAADIISDTSHQAILKFHGKLYETSSISDFDARLIGLRHGVTAHGTLVCAIFAASLISKVFFAATLPQYAIVLCIVASVLLTIASITATLSDVAQYRKKQYQDATEQLEAVEKLVKNVKQAHDTSVLTDIDNETAFSDLCDGTPFLNWTLASWLEVLRSTGSGLMKGPKSIDFILLTFFDASNQHDHKNDDPTLTLILIVSLILCAIIWTLRALAKLSAKLREKGKKASLPSATSADNLTDNQDTPRNNTEDEDWEGYDDSNENAQSRRQAAHVSFFTPVVEKDVPRNGVDRPSLSRAASHNNVGQDAKASVSNTGIFALRSQTSLALAPQNTNPTQATAFENQ